MRLYLCFLLLNGLPLLVLAQTNYVVRTPNSTTPGTNNTLIGPSAGNLTMTGTNNSFLGYNAGNDNTTGTQNSFIGTQAGFSNTTGNNNSFIGSQAGYSNTTGNSNSFIGRGAGYNNTTGTNNMFVGLSAGGANTTGNQNSFIGTYAGYNNITGVENSFVGNQAGYNNSTGNSNVFLGYQAGFKNTTASNNVFIGYQSGQNNTTGLGNLFMGNAAGIQSNGSYNLFIGNGSGYNNTSGLGNTFIGDGSGYGSTTGQNNTYIGRAANYSGNGAGNYNTFIGFGAGTNGPTVNNATAIGVNAIVTVSNAVVLGSPGSRVGIGNSAPNNTLEITKGTANQSGLRFTNLTNSAPATSLNQTKFLSVNEQGDVVMASVNGSAREGVSESLWQRKGSFLQSTQNDAVIIGSNVARTPSGYKLFVEEGILTEKVKVAVKNTNDWSDYVFTNTYQLKDLVEVETFIKANKHLPGVPSAEEMVEKGNDLHKTDAKLLEKIEELTLYSIEQYKENQSLKEEMADQKAKVEKLEKMLQRFLEKK
ncbi:hypothetical protein GCM10027592_47050 [Spirosoma flavus]